jgi:ABC-type glutathione transport system ATPase component
MYNKTYLSVAQFIIQINFEEAEHLQMQKQFIESLYKEFSPFIISKANTIDYEIVIQENLKIRMIEKNRISYIDCYIKQRKKTITYYHISLVQLKIILKNIVLYLLQKNEGFILHASAVNINKGVVVFCGPSGAGKSTMAKILSDYGNYKITADDNIIINKSGANYCVFQTPFVDKFLIQKRSSPFKLRGLIMLQRAKNSSIQKISKPEKIFELLISQLITNNKHLKKQTKTVFKFIKEYNNIYNLENGYLKQSMDIINNLLIKL